MTAPPPSAAWAKRAKDHLGEIHNNRKVIARASDTVVRRRRGGSIVTQRTRNWTVECSGCGRTTTTTWQAIRLKGCFTCSMMRTRKDEEHVNATTRMHSWKKGAAVRGLEWGLTFEHVKEIVRSPCHYCGIVRGNSTRKRNYTHTYNGPDRVDNSLGYTIDNVVPCCGICNRAKQAMSYDDFVRWLDQLTSFRTSNTEDKKTSVGFRAPRAKPVLIKRQAVFGWGEER